VTNEAAHRYARERGVSRSLYALARAVLVPFLRLWFRMRITGAENIPREGAAIVAPNHKSFYDSFFVALATPRPMRFMAKTELVNARYGWLLVRLGAFPVRRGRRPRDRTGGAAGRRPAGAVPRGDARARPRPAR
jgi:1-acyl-sn-glycerol-3-phosphate acyltransferase